MTEIMHVLHSVPDMNAGGLENFIMNVYRNVDRSRIQFDFLQHHSYDSFFDHEIRSLGGRIYRYPVVENKNVLGYQRYIKSLLRQHPEIRVVHSHMSSLSFAFFAAAKSGGCAVRICHSHSTSHDRSLKGWTKYALSRFAAKDANVLLACSTEAGRYLFGSREFQVQRNVIDTTRFAFDAVARRETRRQLGVSEEFVVGHIGRFSYAKNHSFIVQIFEKVRQMRPEARLVLVGDGEPEVKESVKALVHDRGLDGAVVFPEVTDSPEHFYSAFDAFLFPSLFEGLPLTGVEAQCSGLPCFFSDSITPELNVSRFATYLSLSDSATNWAAHVCAAPACVDRALGRQEVEAAGYEAVAGSKVLVEKYLDGFGMF